MKTAYEETHLTLLFVSTSTHEYQKALFIDSYLLTRTLRKPTLQHIDIKDYFYSQYHTCFRKPYPFVIHSVVSVSVMRKSRLYNLTLQSGNTAPVDFLLRREKLFNHECKLF